MTRPLWFSRRKQKLSEFQRNWIQAVLMSLLRFGRDADHDELARRVDDIRTRWVPARVDSVQYGDSAVPQ